MTNFQKLKNQIEALQSEFFYININVSKIEKHCDIPQGSLSRAIKRNQQTVDFDDKLGKLFEQLYY